MTEYNSQYFSAEDIANGTFQKFLQALIDFNRTSDSHYNDIHIYPEEDALIIEWVQVNYSNYYDYGEFTYVGPEQKVMSQLFLPDNSSVLYETEEEKKELLEEWYNENPDYKQERKI